MSDLPRSPKYAKTRGQATVEYILLIGLIVIFLIALLFLFRNSVIEYTEELVAWIEGKNIPAPEPPPSSPPSSPPPPPSSAATPTSTPSPTPTPSNASTEWLDGRWCSTRNFVWITPAGSGNRPPESRTFRTDPAGGTDQASPLGPNAFRVDNSSNPSDFTELERQSDGTIIVTKTSGGYGQARYRRC